MTKGDLVTLLRNTAAEVEADLAIGDQETRQASVYTELCDLVRSLAAGRASFGGACAHLEEIECFVETGRRARLGR